MFRPENPYKLNADEKGITSIIDAMDEKGAWIETIRVWNSVPGKMTPTHTYEGWKRIRGISHRTYMKHMRMFMSFLEKC